VPFIDFAELKKSATIERTVEHLRLQTKQEGSQLRTACPACGHGGDRAIVITPHKQMFYCFAKKPAATQSLSSRIYVAFR